VLTRQRPLELRILGGRLGVGQQSIAEVDVVAVERAAVHDDVGVVTRAAGRPAQRLATGCPQVAFVAIAEPDELLDRRRDRARHGHHHVEVDDRFGGQARHGGRADMLHDGPQAAHDLPDGRGQALELLSPSGVGVDDDDRVRGAHRRRRYGRSLASMADS
jgi:hypothetical protein